MLDPRKECEVGGRAVFDTGRCWCDCVAEVDVEKFKKATLRPPPTRYFISSRAFTTPASTRFLVPPHHLPNSRHRTQAQLQLKIPSYP